jgi:hypothetical protein
MSDTVQEKKKKKTKKKKNAKIFQEIQKKLAIIGFAPKQQQNSNRTFSKIQFWGIIASILSTSLTVVHIFHDANSSENYMYSIFSLAAGVSIAVSEVSFAFKNDKLFDMINFTEELITEKGEL